MSSPSELLHYFEQTLRIRRLEEEAAKAYMQGTIGGFLHLYIGQEAIAVGTEAAIRKSDYIITTYRDHGFALTRGIPAASVFAELFGRDTGCSRGLGGSMHMFDSERRFLGGHAIVGGHVALATGVGFRSKYLKTEDVCVCFFGEGATNIGGFHEGISLASLWKLPVVFVCENNQYSMGTPIERTMPVHDLTLKAPGYGVATDRFEGSDVSVVKSRIAEAVAHARSGKGPVLVEIMTYRFRGHSMSDPGKYRTAEEVERYKKDHDPLEKARQSALGKTSTKEVEAVEQRVEEEIARALAEALAAPLATMASATQFVMAKEATRVTFEK